MKKIKIILIVIVIAISLFFLRREENTDANQKLTQEINQKVENEIQEETKEQTEKEVIDEKLIYQKKFTEAQKVNEETVGWLKIPDTPIDFPVAHTDNNDYYLNHNIYKKRDPVGAIYLDYENNVEEKNNNLILYGHSLARDNMFSDLLNYKDKSYFEKHNKIYLYNNGELEEYTAVAGFVMNLAEMDKIFHFNEYIHSDDEMNSKDYMDEVLKRAVVSDPQEIKAEDKLITLSTCSYEYDDTRFILVGVKR